MSASQAPKRPSVAASVLIAFLLIPAHLYMTWVLEPALIGMVHPFGDSDALFVPTSPVQLVVDLSLTFVLSVVFLWFVQHRARPHGTIIAAVIAFCAWAAYFGEVGYFPGMLHSEYPGWYEVASFVKYPLAFAVSWSFRRRD